jgi:hypothetical protein
MADVQTHGSVTQASPLRVIVDGATVDSSAMALDGATYTLTARVTITVRTPLIPLVIGVES